MVTFLGGLFGLLGALFPELLKFWRMGAERRHELDMLELQLKAGRQRALHRREEIGIYADLAEQQLVYHTYQSGTRWVDALNGTVRPVVAYGFFFLYAGLKVSQWMNGFFWLLWCEEDQAMLAGILSFYFGHRAIQKAGKA
jgi:hypothetical protein